MRKILFIIFLFGLVSFLSEGQITRKQLIEEFLKFKKEYTEKREKGYDVRKARFWVRKAREEYSKGNYEKAKEYLDKAFSALSEEGTGEERVGEERKEGKIDTSLPEAPEKGWKITESPNTYIDKKPTVKDFVPIGITYQLGKDKLLKYIPGCPWQQSCFIFIAIGKDEDGKRVFYQGRLPFRGNFRPRIEIGRRYFRKVPSFGGGMYYYEEGIEGYPYPTVLVNGKGGYKEIISYDEKNGIWYHAIIPPDEKGLKIEIKGKSLGTPFWIASQEGPYIIHGAYTRIKDVDAWGGFWVVGKFEGKIRLPGKEEKKFSGFFIFDRATHIAYYSQKDWEKKHKDVVFPPRGNAVEFSCIAIFHDDFIITLSHSEDPTPVNFPKFQHQGRINYIFNESYTFNNFTFRSFGEELQPIAFEIIGDFKDGFVHLMGTAIDFYPPGGFAKFRGSWWDRSGERSWGRALISWNGEIEFKGRKIKVKKAIGIGEFTRFKGKKFKKEKIITERRESVEKRLKNIPEIKVAIVYERIGDGKRSIEDEIKIFKEIKPDFIFRAFWRWSPCPERPEDVPGRKRVIYKLRGYTYQQLEEAIKKIKREIPGILICGAIPAQIIQKKGVRNAKKNKIIRYPETWSLALNPSKWGIHLSKEEFQCRFGKTHFWVPKDLNCKKYKPEIASAYFPDITNRKFQELLLSWAERQIDAGVDAIWIDMLFKQAIVLYKETNDFNHPGVKESYKAACEIVDKIHEYGKRIGRDILVGTWATPAYFPYSPPELDFVTISPSSKEVRELKIDEEKWDVRLKLIREKFGNIPIFAFIDWAGTTNTPLGQFSQKLTKEEQRKFLEKADEYFSKKGVIFAYPVHGGLMGMDAEILSFGQFKIYDSLAPEFQTYQKIKELAEKKRKKSD